MLTFFLNSFIVRLCGKFVIKPYLNIPPHLKHAATLPCEMSVQKSNVQEVFEANCRAKLSHSETF